MLTGYFSPTSGTIRVKDASIDDHLLEIKQLIGYLPESAPIYQNMLVYDYLDYIARIRGLDRIKRQERLLQLSDLCGLNDIMHKTVDTLSKGLKQRVGLAHAMMNDPEILILDEPTSGLDPNQIIEIRDIIRQIGKHKTVILSTHILSEAQATCDRIVIIDRGKIVADDRTENLIHRGDQEHVIQLTLMNADIPEVEERLRGMDGVIDVEPVEGNEKDALSLRIVCEGDADLRPAVYQVIKSTDWILLELRQESKDLETIFRELTRENKP
jgi:ABC-2 type transport system ATP-binding protein